MMLPKEIRQSASRFANEHSNGSEELKSLLVSTFIQGAIVTYEHYDIGSWDGAFVSEGIELSTAERTIFDEPSVPQFADFWSLYDYKKAKPQAEKMWNRLTNAQRMEIMDGLPSYLASTPDKQYRMHPATYINPSNERWKDELTIRKGKENGKSVSADEQEFDFFREEQHRILSQYKGA